ncbi:alkylphosphocholine resistance protein lem3 [Sorochytrium milnesiophthora]
MSDEKPKTRRPANTAFKQQRLKAWQPLLTPKSVLPTLFIIGIIFAPLGAFLLNTSNSVSELIIDYTKCSSATSTFAEPLGSAQLYTFSGPGSPTPAQALQWKYETNVQTFSDAPQQYSTNVCTLQFSIPQDMPKPVFLYYRLTNFYQNHRRYVKSYDAKQLKGTVEDATTLDDNCSPFGKVNSNDKSANPQVYYPCGLIARSVFNDTISNLTALDQTATSNYTYTARGIAWPSDSAKYGRPSYPLDPNQYIPPDSWQTRYGSRYTDWPNLAGDERFQVWMRTAGLPNFRKLYGRNDDTDLKKGVYQIRIEDNFNVKDFGGTKSIVISTVSFLGGKNSFLGYAYIIVGVICVVLAAVFAARHLYKPRKLGDHTYLSWNHPPPTGGAAAAAAGGGAAGTAAAGGTVRLPQATSRLFLVARPALRTTPIAYRALHTSPALLQYRRAPDTSNNWSSSSLPPEWTAYMNNQNARRSRRGGYTYEDRSGGLQRSAKFGVAVGAGVLGAVLAKPVFFVALSAGVGLAAFKATRMWLGGGRRRWDSTGIDATTTMAAGQQEGTSAQDVFARGRQAGAEVQWWNRTAQPMMRHMMRSWVFNPMVKNTSYAAWSVREQAIEHLLSSTGDKGVQLPFDTTSLLRFQPYHAVSNVWQHQSSGAAEVDEKGVVEIKFRCEAVKEGSNDSSAAGQAVVETTSSKSVEITARGEVQLPTMGAGNGGPCNMPTVKLTSIAVDGQPPVAVN